MINKIPKIKNSKIKKKTSLDIYLRKAEKNLLYRKYRKSGMCHEEAGEKIVKIVKYLEKLKEKMKKQNKSEIEIINNFKEEFAKLCEEGR